MTIMTIIAKVAAIPLVIDKNIFSFSGNKGCTAVIGVMAVRIATSIIFLIHYDGSN